MSKNINVTPGQYKVKGRERQGEDIVHADAKAKLATDRKTKGPKFKATKKR
jgi:hypothetical protein